MDDGLIVYRDDNGLYGVKDTCGNIVINPMYKEMYPFSCGLSMVRNQSYGYAYVNRYNEVVVPFGKYSWCDSGFVCGYARVVKYSIIDEKDKWGIIDTKGNVVVPFEYDKIWVLKEGYLHCIKAFKGNKETRINLFLTVSRGKVQFDGLNYLATYSVDEFKTTFHCSRIDVKKSDSGKLYFTYGCNFGFVALKGIPKVPVISIVVNSAGKLFLLLHEKEDTGKTSFGKKYNSTVKDSSNGVQSERHGISNEYSSDSYGDEQVYYDGWDRDDIESGLADAYEGDLSAMDLW